MRTPEFVSGGPESFVGCRVGLELKNYQEDLSGILETNNIDLKGNFILTPIGSPRALYYGSSHHDAELGLIPDLVLDTETWILKVAVSIGPSPIQLYDRLIKHALYLPAPVIVIDCPDDGPTREALAEVINRNLRQNSTGKLILFRTRVSKNEFRVQYPRNAYLSDLERIYGGSEPNEDSGLTSFSDPSSADQSPCKYQTYDNWSRWNDFRSLLEPDDRIGVCLEFIDVVDTQTEEFKRWLGEPINMIILNTDLFSSTKGFNNMRPAYNLKEFMRSIALATSLKTAMVVQARENLDMQGYLNCLSDFCDMLADDHPDDFRAWNDRLLSPLQPLSCNLDSSTYQIFENDKVKYSQYHLAMVEALNHLMYRKSSIGRKIFIIMVLGAGRGPLVDAMIKAILGLNVLNVTFKIYALDKNYSSIRSLIHKKIHFWDNYSPTIQAQVVKADMRLWEPEEKADIIATELLGSLSDNELSPECIDGTWRFATPETISIPQSYTSHIAPILSYRLEQALHMSRLFTQRMYARDSLQVVRLSNFYQIDEIQDLFTFTHYDISNEPTEGSNRREKKLTFISKVDTICHGFAGFFSANLFGSINITTLASNKTPTMESWFSAFIPIASPINLPAGTTLEVEFSRKDSAEKVWYEWKIIRPIESRVHSLAGNGTAMSKLI